MLSHQLLRYLIVEQRSKSVSIIVTHLRLQNSICVHQLVADQAAKSPDAAAVGRVSAR
jgi:non-ribosomal peptide synthetase component F